MTHAKKYAPVCAWCHQPKRSRYRALVDDYLCEACHHGLQETSAEAPQTTLTAAGPEAPTTIPAGPADAVVELAQFDLRHLVTR